MNPKLKKTVYILLGSEACRIYNDYGIKALVNHTECCTLKYNPNKDSVEFLLESVIGWHDFLYLTKEEYKTLKN